MVEGPLLTKAATHTAMKAPEVPMMSNIPSADPPDSYSLENGRASADYQRRKDGPRKVTLGLLSNPSHNDYGQDHRCHNYHGGLKTGPNGY